LRLFLTSSFSDIGKRLKREEGRNGERGKGKREGKKENLDGHVSKEQHGSTV
jgi:hypothetical protein